jgi:hypothetical protein
VAQLLGIGDGVDGLDQSVGDVERDDQDGPPIVAEEQRPGLAVDLGEPHLLGAQELEPGSEPGQQPGDPLAPVHRPRERLGFPATVGVGDDVRGQQANEPLGVPLADRLQEPAGELLAPLA